MAAEKYRTLASMLRAGQFTVESLQSETGINASTIRTVINRYRNALEEDLLPTGMRGGQRMAYKVKPEARASIQEELKGLFSEVSGNPVLEADLSALRQERIAETPAELRAAEHLLDRCKSLEGNARVRTLRHIAANIQVAERILGSSQAYSSNRAQIQARLERAKKGLHQFEHPVPDDVATALAEAVPRARPKASAPPKEVIVAHVRAKDIATASFVRGIFHGRNIAVKWVDASHAQRASIASGYVYVAVDSSKNRAEAKKRVLEKWKSLRVATKGAQLCVVDAAKRNDVMAAAVESVHGYYIPDALNITFNGLFWDKDEAEQLPPSLQSLA